MSNDNLHGITIDTNLGVAFLPLEQSDDPEKLRASALEWIDKVREAGREEGRAALAREVRDLYAAVSRPNGSVPYRHRAGLVNNVEALCQAAIDAADRDAFLAEMHPEYSADAAERAEDAAP